MNYKFYTDKKIREALTDNNASNIITGDMIEYHVKNYFDSSCIYIYPVINCTSANTLSVLSALKSGDNMLCSEIAHLLHYEQDAIRKLGAIEIDTLKTVNGKISAESLKDTLCATKKKYALLSITQPTEVGTVYTLNELEQLYQLASAHHILIHIDGARFFYAVNYLHCRPHQILSYSDFLTLGLTKFGNAFGDLVITKNDMFIAKLLYLQRLFFQEIPRKKLLFRQIETFFHEKLYLFSAKHAHEMAVYMCDEFKKLAVNVLYPVQANILYVQLSENETLRLLQHYRLARSSRHKNTVRVVLSYATTWDDIQNMIQTFRAIRSASPE